MTAEPVTAELLHPWSVYLRAGEEARCRGDRRVGTDHILLALLDDPAIEALLGVTLNQARLSFDTLDQEALEAIGMPPGIDAPRMPMRDVPARPGFRAVMDKGRLRLTPAAKKVLEEAVKPLRHKTQVTGRQVLAQILNLQAPDPAAALMEALGVDRSVVRRRMEAVTADGS